MMEQNRQTISNLQFVDNGLHYLLIINKQNEPLFFKSYQTSTDELNIQLHCYASLDFLDEKWMEKSNEYLGSVYTIYNLSGQYAIFAFYTVTKIKILGIFKQKTGQKYDDNKVKNFFNKAYKLYKKQLYQPFINTLDQNKFSKKFHYQLDLIASTHKINEAEKYDTEEFYLFYVLNSKRIIKAQKKVFQQIKKVQ